jgi:tetrahydromethanopterin S-methyltransferase subunit H
MAKVFAKDYGVKLLSNPNKPSGYNETYNIADAALVGDTLEFGILPAGVEFSLLAVIHDADADASLALGYRAIDASVTTNLTYFLPATALATAGVKQSVAQPIIFQTPVQLVGTLSGGGIALGTKITVVTPGKGVGIT